jgi:hypothetical protein
VGEGGTKKDGLSVRISKGENGGRRERKVRGVGEVGAQSGGSGGREKERRIDV